MSGAWVFVCGPSGAGKDSVIAWERYSLGPRSDIVFARRMITRPAHPASDHEPIAEADFRFLRESGALAWHWQANGFNYGVPLRYSHQVAWGRVVVVKGSREHVDSCPSAVSIRRVLVTAPPEQLAERLTRRGREEATAIARRMARNAALDGLDADVVVPNDGALPEAGGALCRYLEAVASCAAETHAGA